MEFSRVFNRNDYSYCSIHHYLYFCFHTTLVPTTPSKAKTIGTTKSSLSTGSAGPHGSVRLSPSHGLSCRTLRLSILPPQHCSRLSWFTLMDHNGCMCRSYGEDRRRQLSHDEEDCFTNPNTNHLTNLRFI